MFGKGCFLTSFYFLTYSCWLDQDIAPPTNFSLASWFRCQPQPIVHCSLYLSGTPSLKTNTIPPSCLLLENHRYLYLIKARAWVEWFGATRHSKLHKNARLPDICRKGIQGCAFYHAGGNGNLWKALPIAKNLNPEDIIQNLTLGGLPVAAHAIANSFAKQFHDKIINNVSQEYCLILQQLCKLGVHQCINIIVQVLILLQYLLVLSSI